MRLRTFFLGALGAALTLGLASSAFGVADMIELELTDEQRADLAGPSPSNYRTMTDVWDTTTGMDVNEIIPEKGVDGEGLEKWIRYTPAVQGEPAQPAGEEYLLEEVIFGKPYRIWAGEKAGTFMVSWGPQSFLWEPKVWHSPKLKKEGPLYYYRWVQPGNLFPWEHSLKEREGYAGADIHNRCYTPVDFGEHGMSYMTQWNIEMYSPDGTPRNKELFEWATAYRLDQGGLPDDLVGKVLAQYSFVFIAPDDFRGLGIAVTVYHGEKYNDEFLYTPASRKVRRLPQGARQDFIPGTMARWEDFPQVKPYTDVNYVLVGTTLHSGPPEGIYGTNNETHGERVSVSVDGLGEPAWVLELRAQDDTYWYKKQRRVIGMRALVSWYEENYNMKGEVTRLRRNVRGNVTDDARMMNLEGPFQGPGGTTTDKLLGYELMWGGEFFTDIKSGFIFSWYMNTFYWNYETIPRDVVNLENLRKEPVRKILFWE